MKYFIICAFLFSGCERYIDNDEFLPPIDKSIEVQVKEMFEFLDKPLIENDYKREKASNN